MGATAPTLPRLGRRSDTAYLDFVEGLRAFALKDPSYEKAFRQALPEGSDSLAGTEIARLVESIPAVQMHNRLMRSQQEMKWHKITASLDADRDAWLSELKKYEQEGPAVLELDPAFQAPSYTNVQFHLQPQSYHGDALGGIRYHLGTKVFFTGDNDEDQLHAALVANAPAPPGPVNSILDLACSIGQSTTALKQRYPSAAVTGIDHSAPMLRAAHRRAVLLGAEVTFSQRLAEATRFADNSFDLVFAFILFHELPIRIVQETVREVARGTSPRRVLRRI